MNDGIPPSDPGFVPSTVSPPMDEGPSDPRLVFSPDSFVPIIYSYMPAGRWS